MPIIGRSFNLKELLRWEGRTLLCCALLSCISLFALQPLVAGLWKVWTMEPPIIAVLLFHWGSSRSQHKDTEILAASIPTSVAVAVAAFSVSLSLLYLVESAWLHSWSQRTLFHADVLIPTNDNTRTGSGCYDWKEVWGVISLTYLRLFTWIVDKEASSGWASSRHRPVKHSCFGGVAPA